MLAGVALLLPFRAGAQDEPGRGVLDEGRPLVERVRFEGVESVDEDELRAGIATQETRCRGTFLLRPLCWLTDWSAVERREFLERSEVPLDELRLEVIYFRRGFRQALVAAELAPHGRGVEVVFHVAEGPPTILDTLHLVQTEEVLTDRQLRRAQLPREGEPLDLGRLESAIFELESRLGQAGYLDGAVLDDIEVLAGEDRARLEVVIVPGPLSTVAELDIQGNEGVSDRVIVDAIRLREGRVLRTTDLVASERALYESNLFHEARIDVPSQADSAKRVVVTVREAPPRNARVGGGFSTVEFFQLDGRYTHYNWLGRGRRLDLQGSAGNFLASTLNARGIFRNVLPPNLPPDEAAPFLRPTWRVGGELMQPGFLSTENRLGLGVFAHRRSIPGIVIDEAFGANLSLTRRVDLRTPISLEYRFEMTAVDAGDLYFCAHFTVCDLPSIEALRGRHRLSPLGLGFFRDRADDAMAPRTGHRARLELEHASAVTLSEFRYNRISGEVAGYLPLDVLRTRVLAGRLRAGWVRALPGTGEAIGLEAPDLALLHPRRRFFAGGSRSVRGFGENQLGPRVLTVGPAVLGAEEHGGCSADQVEAGACDPNLVPFEFFSPRPLGGRSVLEASVEYRFPLFGPLRSAVFVDAAVVSNGIGDLFTQGVGAITPGIGFRYPSPVAPIRVDLGYRPTVVEQLPVLTEVVGEDGERRLVSLDLPRRWDPVGEAEGGFFRRALARLRLHVSIGEAF